MTAAVFSQDAPGAALPFTGWSIWGGLSASVGPVNTVTLNSTAAGSAGYVTAGARALAGRRLILDITGTEGSQFYNGQLLKLEADDIPIIPEDLPFVRDDGYIPANDGRAIFAIPGSVRGKINIVFYQATLKDLKITAYYR
jgi:hypothetical protein